MAKGRYDGSWLLALDAGTNSVGWAAFRLDRDRPNGLLDGGVRLFDWGRHPVRKDSLNKQRGEARRARNRLAAKVWRRKRLMSVLSGLGVTVANVGRTDVWCLRARAASERLSPSEIGACLMHMGRHRGFKSLALVEQDPEEQAKRNEELTKWSEAERTLRQEMAAEKVNTVAQLFAKRLAAGRPVRARRGEGVVPTRRLVREEFAALRRIQAHLGWPEQSWNEIEDAIFDQRPLIVPGKGRCSAFPEDERMAKALPSSQQFLVRQALCNLRIDHGALAAEVPLSNKQFATIAAILDRGDAPSWAALRAAIKLPRGLKFTIERTRVAGESKASSRQATGDETAAALIKLFPDWPNRPLDERDALVTRLLQLRRDRRALLALATELGLAGDDSAALADAVQFVLPRGHLAFGARAVAKILPHLVAGTRTHDAIEKGIGRPHAERPTLGRLDSLPYYGEALPHRTLGGTGDPTDDAERRYGRLGNVTVHIALNQIRHIVNGLMARYGRPRRIVVETTRQLKANAEQLRAIEIEQAKREKDNREADKDFAEAHRHAGKAGVSRHERWRRHRLAKRQGLLCPYTGDPISIADLCTADYQIDHVIPRSRGGTDAEANLVVCKAGANSAKLDRTAWQAFRGTDRWPIVEDFLSRLKASDKRLHEMMAWRFGPRAAEIANQEDGGWAPRQIVDTSYIARVALEYLKLVADDVVATKGSHTGYIRAAWGLPKDRGDQRHHFVDAAVIGCTDRSIIQALNHLHARGALPKASESGLPLPYPDFVLEIERRYERLWPSLRPDHSVKGMRGQFHNDLLFGKSRAPDGAGWRRTRRYTPEDLFKDGDTFRSDKDVEAAIDSFVSQRFRERFRDLLAARRPAAGAKPLAEVALAAARDPHWGPRGIGEIRCFVDDKGRSESDFSTVPRGNHRAIVDTNANAWIEIAKDAAGKWRGTVVSVLEASKRPHPLTQPPAAGKAPALVLQRKDLVAWEHDGKTVIGWIKVIVGDGRFYTWPLRFGEDFEALKEECRALGISTRDGKYFRADGFMKAGGRKVTVSILGRLRDPGPSKG